MMSTINNSNIITVKVPKSQFIISNNHEYTHRSCCANKCTSHSHLISQNYVLIVNLSNYLDRIMSLSITTDDNCDAYVRIGSNVIYNFVVSKGTKTYHFECAPSLLDFESIRIILFNIGIQKMMISGIKNELHMSSHNNEKVIIKPNLFCAPITYENGSFLYDGIDIHDLELCATKKCFDMMAKHKNDGLNMLFHNIKLLLITEQTLLKDVYTYILNLLLDMCNYC